MKRRKLEIVDKTENKLLVIFKSHDGNAMMMMIERKTCKHVLYFVSGNITAIQRYVIK